MNISSKRPIKSFLLKLKYKFSQFNFFLELLEKKRRKSMRAVPLQSREVYPLGKQDINSTEFTQYRRILLVGWYGAQNFGDELMLHCLLKRYQRKAKVREFFEISVLIEKNQNYRFLNIPDDVKCFYPPETEKDIVNACATFDEIILGGGSHIDDTPIKRLDFIPYLILKLSIEAIRQKKTVKWIATSTNKSLSDLEYLCSLKQIAGYATEFSVRDDFSLNALKQAGIPNVSLVRDIAFDIRNSFPSNEKIVLITLVDFVSSPPLEVIVNDIFSFFANRMETSIERWRICFLPFYLQSGHDLKLFRDILLRTNSHSVPHFIAEEIENSETMLLLFRSADLSISMRYHAALISNIYNVPNLILCSDSHRHYFNKMHSLAISYPKISRLIDISSYSSHLISKTLSTLIATQKSTKE